MIITQGQVWSVAQWNTFLSDVYTSVADYGADLTGTVDSTLAFTNALAAAPAGSTVTIPSGGRCRVLGNITIPANVTLKGPQSFLGTSSSNSMSANYALMGGSISLGSTVTITQNAGSCIDGLLIYRDGITFPATDSSLFAGTAITFAGDDCTVKNSMILGFAQAITSNGNQRPHILHCKFDNLANIYINNSQDIHNVEDCHAWPFAVFRAGVTGPQMQRSGASYSINASNDWGRWIGCFAYAYNTGFFINGANSLNLIGCGADNTAASYGTGFAVQNGATDITFTSCQSAGNISGFFINNTAGLSVQLNGCHVWGDTGHGVQISGGDVQIWGGEIRNAPNGVTVNSGAGLVDVNGVRFDGCTNIFNITSATTNLRVGPQNNYGALAAGGQPLAGSAAASAPVVASAATFNIPPNALDVIVSGTTGIGQINGGWQGRVTTLYFQGICSVFHSTGATNDIRLSGAATYTSTAGSTLTLRHNGVQWYEIGRSA